MKNVEIFHNIEFGSVRVLEDGDRLLFCGNDVAAALGYRDPRKAVARYCKEGVKRPILSKGGAQETIVIPEGDVYRRIVGSKLPDAQRFERWLFEEVVPSIRKHGAYITSDKLDEIKDDPEALTRLAAALEQEQKKVERLNEENVALQNKAMYYDYFCEVGLCTNISTTAKELNIPTKRFVEFLLRGSFLYRTIRGVLLPYSETLTGGLFEVKDFCVNGRHGVYTLITPEGKALFRLLIPERNSNRRAVDAQ